MTSVKVQKALLDLLEMLMSCRWSVVLRGATTSLLLKKCKVSLLSNVSWRASVQAVTVS